MDSCWTQAAPETIRLTHGLEMIRQGIEAEVAYSATARGGVCQQDPPSIVVGLSAALIRPLDLGHWASDVGSVLEYLAGHAPVGQVLRPIETVGSSAVARSALFRRIERVRSVGDALTVALEREGGRQVFVFMRWASRPRFGSSEEHALAASLEPLADILSNRQQQTPGPTVAVETRPASQATYDEMLARLSRTEQKVLHYLRQSMTEKQIAEEIERSPHTVHVHVKSIYLKLGVSSRKELFSRVG
ncbi:helix-turn-helix transcriptional regulator [Mucisphaera calidilacus]|uniref:Transcriptional regulator NarL n=1 Tax=Mucisphaera calidilacus TaxID=2527982 RepID=A0A518C137_9BACT|nr:helix-turn-helix transcriptional regulator [Mucisphaera calidilacus]QDU72928.1 transcriptional regulator NarL [Mucisphaera calidilacus]